MKSPEELNALKTDYETLCRKLATLNEEELEQVTGGTDIPKDQYENIILSVQPEEHNVILACGGVTPGGCDCSGLIT